MKYRITAYFSHNDERIIEDIEAVNEDLAWGIFKLNKYPRTVYNGTAEELPTRAELIAKLAALKTERDTWRNFFFTIVSPDGFFQHGIHEECPICEQEKEHAVDCELAAALKGV